MLPNTYWQLEYIQSDGNQYITTGLIPNAIGRVKTSVTFTTSGRQLLFCSWESGSNKAYFIERTTSNNYNFESTGVTKSASTTTALTTNNKYEIDVDLVNNSILINDNKMCTTSGFTTATRELYLFASNDADEGVYVKCSTKLDYLEVYDKNGTLIRNFIPAMRISDFEIGLYDDVNDVFYTNAGSGTFIAGSIIDAPLNITFTDNPLTFGLSESISLIANFKKATNCRFKVNGEWKMAMMYKKINGEWLTGPTRVKVNGTWKDGS